MNPAPTPDFDPIGPKLDGRAALERSLEKLDSPSQQPVDIARLRELLTVDKLGIQLGDRLRLNSALRNAAPALLDELERLRAEPKGEDLIFIRCINHMHVPQQNDATVDGAECGACIAAERDKLREKVERLREQNTSLISELENYRPIAEVSGATIAISERDKAISERDSLRRENEELLAKLK